MKTAVFLTLALSLPLLAENAVMIDDFEHGISGWSGYKDAASQAPVFSLSDDALRGDNALKVKFNGCQRYQGIQFFKAPRLPQGAKAISFLIKPLSGPPPGDLTLSERSSRYGKDLATATIRLAVTGSDWQKITVPLNTMKPAGRNKRGTVFTFKPGSLYLLRLNGAVSDQPSFFLLDEIKWEIE